MNKRLGKKLKKIISAIDKIDKFPRSIIVYGTKISFSLLIVGTVLYIYNQNLGYQNIQIKIISMSLVQSSFTILAEAIIGGLIIDYILRK